MSISLIPESAPFNEEQRAWLNGFLAGWTGVADVMANGAATGEENGSTTAVLEEEEDFPWHDSSLEIDDRLALAEGKPLKRQLMAAMAQLNCGACGYLCQTYSEAIAAGDEKNLTLCSPGGKETAKMLKKLIKEKGGVAAGGAATNGAAKPAGTGVTRANPYAAPIKSCENLNREGSSKYTTHAVIDLAGSGVTYQVGDSLGVYPTNCPDLVDEILTALDAEGDADLRSALTDQSCLRSVSDELLELIASSATSADEQAEIEGLIDSDELDGLDVLDVLRRAPSAKVDTAAMLDCLMEITPRLYSIASSLKAHPDEVHLTVARATAKVGDRQYKGVASTMFADRLTPGDTVRVYAHQAHGFTVPADPSAPMVMVGPGTGIAPFRAFLEERAATEAPGQNWLFFGDQHAATDFLYEAELNSWQEQGLLTHLSTAFSRDQEEKIYVQDRMREQGAELFAWLESGGYFFVCGDAKRMAADVERALHDVIIEHGGMKMAEAMQYVASLKNEQRYVRDVY